MSKNSNIRIPIAISLGAIAGALCRYYLGLWLTQSLDTVFLIGTIVVNLSGCFLMGLITTLVTECWVLSPDLIHLLTTGFLGAYTTFSSYELDAANLLELKSFQNDLVYWIGSPLLGFLCFNLGVSLTKLARRLNSSQN